MNISKSRDTTRRTIFLDITGALPLQGESYGSKTFTYRPTRALVGLLDGTLADVQIHGPNVKKDGTDGELLRSVQYGGYYLFGLDELPAAIKTFLRAIDITVPE